MAAQLPTAIAAHCNDILRHQETRSVIAVREGEEVAGTCMPFYLGVADELLEKGVGELLETG